MDITITLSENEAFSIQAALKFYLDTFNKADNQDMKNIDSLYTYLYNQLIKKELKHRAARLDKF